MEIPVYVLTGFLESGKTSFMKDTLADDEFASGERTLLIVCEEGLEDYEKTLLDSTNTTMVIAENEEDFTIPFLNECQEKYQPERVLIEYNGMWKADGLFQIPLPKDWLIVQVISIADASTFEVYLNNMRSFVTEHFKEADMVIFNRCTNEMNQGLLKRTVRALNRRAQVYYELEDGSPAEPQEEELPFDKAADTIKIEEEDFGLWYLDALDHGEDYQNKKVIFKGMVYKSKRFHDKYFVPGRFAMTCCADDVAFIGFLCYSGQTAQLENKTWVTITADVKIEYQKEYKGKGPVLYLQEAVPAAPAKEKLVYFN